MRLILRLNAVYQDPPIALHHDFSQCPAEFLFPSNVRLVEPSIATAWGQFSLVRSMLAGIETLYSAHEGPEWFALLSGACYPTMHSEAALSNLEEGGYDAYMHHELIDPMAPRRPYQKLCIWRYFDWNIPYWGNSVVTGYRNIKTPDVIASQSSVYTNGFACYAGSQWFTARGSVAEYILRWSRENPWLADHLLPRPCPDETYFHSIVCNAKQFRVSQNAFRYIDWSAGGWHPKTLAMEDLAAILNSGAHFARKIAPESPVLDALDQHLEGECQTIPKPANASNGQLNAMPRTRVEAENVESLTENAAVGKISVVIPTFRRAQSLERALRSLEAQTDTDFEVVVVCDGDDPETKRLSATFQTSIPLKWVFNRTNQYAAAARNVGANAAEGNILLFLDDDATAGPDWIRIHRSHHEAENVNRPILVLGRTVHSYERPAASRSERLLREERETREAEFAAVLKNPDAYPVEELQFHSDCGFNCSIRRSVFLKSGGFDANMRPRLEDLELGLRLYKLGVETVVDPEAVLTHYESKNLVDDTRSYWQHGLRLAYYRLAQKGQRNAQTSALRRLKTANPVRRLQQVLSWHAPSVMRGAADFSRAVCDRTGSGWFLHQWKRLQSSTEGMQVLRSDGIRLEQVRSLVGNPLLVLAIHSITSSLSKQDERYHVTPAKLRALLKMLDAFSFQSVASDAVEGLSRKKSYLLTIDDGFEELHAQLLPLIEPYRLKPLVFVVVDRLGGFNEWESPVGYTRRKLLSVEQMRELARYGVEFGSHTCTHPWLPSLTEDDLWHEVHDSKRRLEDLLGTEVTSFAYPYGGANAHIRATVAQAGYKRAFSVSPGLSFWDDPTWIKRVEVAETDTRLDLLLKMFTGKSASQRVYEQTTRLRKLLRPAHE